MDNLCSQISCLLLGIWKSRDFLNTLVVLASHGRNAELLAGQNFINNLATLEPLPQNPLMKKAYVKNECQLL